MKPLAARIDAVYDATKRREVTNRLAACIYFADMDVQRRPTVLWDMVTPTKQNWYLKQAAKVLKYAETRDAKTVLR